MEHNYYNIQLDTKQILQIVQQMDYEDKIKVFDQLKKSTFKNRFNKFINSLSNCDITFDEITEEVELVRSKRYEERKCAKNNH